MRRYADVDEAALQSALHSLDRASSHASAAISEINKEASRIRAANEAARGIIRARFGQVNVNIGTCQSRIGEVNERLAHAKFELASCRPGQWVTVSHVNSDGSVSYSQQWSDPDAGKRKAAQAEIALCESKLTMLQSALSEMESVRTRYYQGLAATSQVADSLAEGIDAVSHASNEFDRLIADMETTIHRASACVADYQRVHIEGAYDGSVEELPLLRYQSGRVSFAASGATLGSASYTPKKGPINEIASGPFASAEAFQKYVDDLTKRGEGVSITLRVHRSLSGFPKDLPLGAIAKELEDRGFTGKRTASGTRMIDGEGYYRFTKES